MTYLNPKNELFTPEWVPTTMLALAGGIIMTFAALLFFIVFFGTMFSKKTSAGTLDLPVTEVLHDEKRIPLFDTFKPWLVIMGILILLSYVPAFISANKNPGPGAPPFGPDNPVPEQISKNSNPYNEP